MIKFAYMYIFIQAVLIAVPVKFWTRFASLEI